MVASKCGNIRMVRQLIEAGAELDKYDKVSLYLCIF